MLGAVRRAAAMLRVLAGLGKISVESFCQRVRIAVRKLPGIEKYPNLTCKRGITGSTVLWDCRKEVRDGGTTFPPTRDVTIKLLDEKHAAVLKWKLTNAWCSKLSGPSLNAKGNEIAIETMELAYDRIDLE